MNLKEIPPVRDQVRKCVRCGLCRSVCPVFAEIRNETAAPRGHVFMTQMLRDGEVAPSMKVYEKLGNCLLCETCTINCPSGIDIHELNEACRSYITENNPSLAKNAVFDGFWTRPALMRTGRFFIWAADKTGMRKLGRGLGLTKLLPGDLPKAERIMGELPAKPARGVISAVNPAKGQRKMKVAYFLGCGTDLFSPSVGIATVQALTSLGCEVIVPPDMKCCGLPHIANGKMETARELAAHNLQVFNALDVDCIVTDCASCSSALSEHRFKLLLGDSHAEAIHKFTSKLKDLNVLLLELLAASTELKGRPEITVTYHDPCHLAKAQNIRTQPRELLQMIPGVKLVEMAESDRCCGGSGTFALTHYDLSMKILDKKMDNVEKTNASVIATCCPSCTMQLKHGVSRREMSIEVKHPVELLNQALGN
ncbi:MAG: (Fe-S)-binding protein [Solirubrobacterales bacterium]